MTKKKERILSVGLELFSKDGYHATSTSKVAQKAKVSEGLIFKHFENKKGLIDAIIEEGESRIRTLFTTILTEEDAKAVIRKSLDLPFKIKEIEHNYWKLLHKLQWELEKNNGNKMKPIQDALQKAFAHLRYKKPEQEAAFLIQYLNGLSAAILLDNLDYEDEFKQFLVNKYHL